MVKKLDKAKARAKRHQRVRNKINGTCYFFIMQIMIMQMLKKN